MRSGGHFRPAFASMAVSAEGPRIPTFVTVEPPWSQWLIHNVAKSRFLSMFMLTEPNRCRDLVSPRPVRPMATTPYPPSWASLTIASAEFLPCTVFL